MNFYADNEAVLSSFGDNTAPARWSQGKFDHGEEIRISPMPAVVRQSASTKKWDFRQTAVGKKPVAWPISSQTP